MRSQPVASQSAKQFFYLFIFFTSCHFTVQVQCFHQTLFADAANRQMFSAKNLFFSITDQTKMTSEVPLIKKNDPHYVRSFTLWLMLEDSLFRACAWGEVYEYVAEHCWITQGTLRKKKKKDNWSKISFKSLFFVELMHSQCTEQNKTQQSG